jgi:hypothetical protein
VSTDDNQNRPAPLPGLSAKPALCLSRPIQTSCRRLVITTGIQNIGRGVGHGVRRYGAG